MPQGSFWASTFGYRYTYEFETLSESYSARTVGKESLRAVVGHPATLVGCSAAKTGRALLEDAPNYDTLYQPFTDDPSWFRGLVSRLRVSSTAMAPILIVAGLAGLGLGALRRRRAAIWLLIIFVAQLLWVGLVGQGDTELFRVRSATDLLVVLSAPLIIDLLTKPTNWAVHPRRCAE